MVLARRRARLAIGKGDHGETLSAAPASASLCSLRCIGDYRPLPWHRRLPWIEAVQFI